MKACGLSLSYLLNRRTFDSQLKTIATDINERITEMGNLFVSEGMVKPYVVAIDSALLKSKGHVVWHASSMKKGVVLRSGIVTDARWGFSHAKGWIFGDKLHIICSTDSVIVPLSADVTTANVSDKPAYKDLLIPSTSTSSSSRLSPITLKRIHFVVADPGYDDQSLYDLSMAKGFQLVCPVLKYKNTPEERMKLVDFYQSALGQVIYSRRRISVEPLIEHIKSVFIIISVPARGYDDVCSIVLLAVLLYQILVYYNCKIWMKSNPRSMIKYMLGC